MHTVGNVFFALVGVFGFFVIGHAWWIQILRPTFRRWRFKRDDDSLKMLTDHTDRLHDLFGPSVSIRSVTKADGTYEVNLECPGCRQENRLKKGFKGAVCGRCKRPFIKKVLDTSREKTSPSGREVRLN